MFVDLLEAATATHISQSVKVNKTHTKSDCYARFSSSLRASGAPNLPANSPRDSSFFFGGWQTMMKNFVWKHYSQDAHKHTSQTGELSALICARSRCAALAAMPLMARAYRIKPRVNKMQQQETHALWLQHRAFSFLLPLSRVAFAASSTKELCSTTTTYVKIKLKRKKVAHINRINKSQRTVIVIGWFRCRGRRCTGAVGIRLWHTIAKTVNTIWESNATFAYLNGCLSFGQLFLFTF